MPKAIKTVLSDEQKQELLKLRNARTGENAAGRAHYVLLSSEGKRIDEISEQINRNPPQ